MPTSCLPDVVIAAARTRDPVSAVVVRVRPSLSANDDVKAPRDRNTFEERRCGGCDLDSSSYVLKRRERLAGGVTADVGTLHKATGVAHRYYVPLGMSLIHDGARQRTIRDLIAYVKAKVDEIPGRVITVIHFQGVCYPLLWNAATAAPSSNAVTHSGKSIFSRDFYRTVSRRAWPDGQQLGV